MEKIKDRPAERTCRFRTTRVWRWEAFTTAPLDRHLQRLPPSIQRQPDDHFPRLLEATAERRASKSRRSDMVRLKQVCTCF